MPKPLAIADLKLNGAHILAGTVDPSVAPGVVGGIGSFYARLTTGDWYRKVGPDPTSWLLVGVTSGSSAWYGHGPDGQVTLPAGTTTLTMPMWYEELIVPNGAILEPAGFPVYAKARILVEPGGVIRSNGGNGGVGSGTQGAAGGGSSTAWCRGGIAGGLGATGGVTSSTSAAAMTNYPVNFPANTGLGGAGGVGPSGGGASGSGSTKSTVTSVESPLNVLPPTVWGMPSTGITGRIMGGGGGGGGTGGGSEATRGGSGGGGAGSLLLCAKVIENHGAIEARGGNGGNANGTGGGGGGGGGGIVLRTCRQYLGNPIDVSGGAGGLGGSSNNGQPGQPGFVVAMPG